MKKQITVTNYYGNTIPWHVVEEHAWSPETFELAEKVWNEGDQEPQAFYNNFCAEYEKTYGHGYWLDEKNPQF